MARVSSSVALRLAFSATASFAALASRKRSRSVSTSPRLSAHSFCRRATSVASRSRSRPSSSSLAVFTAKAASRATSSLALSLMARAAFSAARDSASANTNRSNSALRAALSAAAARSSAASKRAACVLKLASCDATCLCAFVFLSTKAAMSRLRVSLDSLSDANRWASNSALESAVDASARAAAAVARCSSDCARITSRVAPDSSFIFASCAVSSALTRVRCAAPEFPEPPPSEDPPRLALAAAASESAAASASAMAWPLAPPPPAYSALYISRWRTIASTMVCVLFFLFSRSVRASLACFLMESTSAWYCSFNRAPFSSASRERARITPSCRLFCSWSSLMFLKSTSVAVTTEEASCVLNTAPGDGPAVPGCFSSVTSWSSSLTCLDKSALCACRETTSRSLRLQSAMAVFVSASILLTSTVVFSSRARICACAFTDRSYSSLCSANIGARCSSSPIIPSTVLCNRRRSKHSPRHASAASAYFVYSSVMVRFSFRSAAADESRSCI